MLIAIAVICALGEAVFTALEVALGAVSRARLRALVETERAAANADGKGSGAVRAHNATRQRAERALHVLEHPERLTLVFITVTSTTLWATTALLTWQVLTRHWSLWSLCLALIGVLFVAEVLPLLLAARNPEAVVLRCAGVLQLSTAGLSPLLVILGGVGSGLARLLGAGTHLTPQVTEGELRTALATAEEEGVIESEERAMLEGAMDFRNKQVREVMTPRIDMVGVAAGASLAEVLKVAMSGGHSRLPVYEGTLDKIVGIIAAKDLIPHLRTTNGTPHCARDLVRPAFFVPPHKLIAPTIEALRHQRTLMAIVVDADGGTAGLVTLEDLLEEIVGDIQDEYDTDEVPALRVIAPPDGAPQMEAGQVGQPSDVPATLPALAPEPHVVACDAGVAVRDFERFWKKSFAQTARLHDAEKTAEPSISLAAWALHLFDGVPQPGQRARAGSIVTTKVDAAWLEMEVLLMDGPRIEEVQIMRIDD